MRLIKATASFSSQDPRGQWTKDPLTCIQFATRTAP